MAPDSHQHEAILPAAPDGLSTVACPDRACAGPEPAPAARRAGSRPDCWFLSGPTASGKTSLAIELAGRLGAEIVSVDSMAVYRGLDIGTAKPTAEPSGNAAPAPPDRRRAGLLESYSVARWLADAAVAVEGCRGRNRQILFVGGTPLYLCALRDGLVAPARRRPVSFAAGLPGRARLPSRYSARSTPGWPPLDPRAATRIHPHDTRRIIRGLEVGADGAAVR